MRTITFLFFLSFTSTLLFGQQAKPHPAGSSKPFVLGVIDEIYSTALGEKRTLNIYLPPGYNASDSIKYPVIYLLDGSADEDFIHIVGLVQFNSFEWINQVPKSIVVGIATVDRRRDFTFPSTVEKEKIAFPTTGHSDRFISFLEKDLQPFIRQKYKTTDSKTIIGQSLGGLFATEILIQNPKLFNKYIIVSPSLWWDNVSLLTKPIPNLENTDIYIGVGKEGVAMEADANVLADKIKNLKNTNVNVYFDYLPLENHATIMHQAVFNAFRLLYPSSLK